jgi:hypothetical protein
VAWKSPEARKDPNLSIQAYYVRLNALNDLLSPFARGLLESVWDVAGSDEMKGVRRSSLIGRLTADLIRALDLKELTESDHRPGDWFIHSGVTYFSEQAYDPRMATIELGDGRKVVASVRRDCEITSTAGVNMEGADDISLVVGRLLSDTRFDLIAAGYRRPPILAVKNPTPTISLENPSGSVLDLIEDERRSPAYAIQYEGWSDEDTLWAAVVDTFDRFKFAVENLGAWRHLYDPWLKSAHESRHQMLFRLFANMAFDAFDIHVHPGADHGSGQTDLTLTLRDVTHVVEFKKDQDKQKIIHGLTVQLPKYMRSARTGYGSFIVMCHERDPREVEELLSKHLRYVNMECRLFTDVVDCRPRKSASTTPFPGRNSQMGF